MKTNTLHPSLVSLNARISSLKLLLSQAAQIRQSLELAFAIAYVESAERSAAECLQLTEEEPVREKVTAIGTFLDAFVCPTLRGTAHDDKVVTHYCVTADKTHGHGIYSAHDNKDDARFNAILTGGKCCAVDRSEDGRITAPAALRDARRIESEYC